MDPDKLIRVVFSLFVMVGLVKVVLDPFGYIISVKLGDRIGSLHSLTFLCLSFLFLFFWRVLRKTRWPTRFMLCVFLCMVAYANYDMFWFADYYTYSPLGHSLTSTIPSYVGYITGWYALPLFGIFLVRWRHPEYDIPRIRLKLFALVLVINFLMILWLESTGFFPRLMQFVYARAYGDPYVDPHSWVWFIGKAIGMLSWILICVDIHKLLTWRARPYPFLLFLWANNSPQKCGRIPHYWINTNP